MPNLFKPDIKREITKEKTLPDSSDGKECVNTKKESEEPITEKEYSDIEKWDEMDLLPEVLRGIYAYGYETPSPIQKKAIQPMRDGRDLIAQAQSGTGKTATFAIGALMTVDTTVRNLQIICVSPTRELTMQISTVFKGLSEFMRDISI